MAIDPKRKRYLKILIIVLVIWLGVIPLSLVAINAIVASNRKPGPARTTVPQLVGLDQKAADAKARSAKLNMQVMMTRSDQPGPPGIILFQTPGAGESVEVGTVVGVSLGVENPNSQLGKVPKTAISTTRYSAK
jgi:beta-lactam-binding protein with PASTA domain